MEKYFSLDKLKIGTKASVDKIIAQGNIRRRLFDLGIVKGTIIEALYESPFGSPVAYLIRGTVIALRSEDASNIIMESI